MPHSEIEFEYKPLAMYPHLGPKDAEIWDEFVHKNPDMFQSVWYDMRVGPMPDCPPDLPQNVKDAWCDLCRGRIDVVAYDEPTLYIIELKPRARGEALGQALNNMFLYMRERHNNGFIMPVVITDIIIPGTQIAAAKMGVALWTPDFIK